jgi:hypothetical protein
VWDGCSVHVVGWVWDHAFIFLNEFIDAYAWFFLFSLTYTYAVTYARLGYPSEAANHRPNAE